MAAPIAAAGLINCHTSPLLWVPGTSGAARQWLPVAAPRATWTLWPTCLSDMGWGPVIDSTIAVAVEQDTATIDVAVGEALEGFDKAIADNLLVTIALPDGVQVESASTAPADCDLGAAPFTCRFASLDSAASIALTLGGVPGVHPSRLMWITRRRTLIRSR